jgi:demethylmenaquinone methyltransferase/2-methoxy-6-polyprenyl-1,4-benzoquinol methylase
MAMKNGTYKTMDEEKEYYSLTKRVWSNFAPFYDIAVTLISGVRDKVVSFTNARNCAKILDVATGTGKQAFAFGKRGYDVIGIDISEAMLKVANKKDKYGNVRFEVADATNLPFEDGSFDVSCVSFALHDMPLTIMEKTLKEMVRVIKPKGTLIVVDYALPKNKINRFLIYQFVKLYEGEYYQKFIESDLEALLRKTGIKIEEQLPVLHRAGRILKGMRMDD